MVCWMLRDHGDSIQRYRLTIIEKNSGDKIILRPCYLQNRISYNGNKAYLYRINAQLLAKPSMPSYELDFK